MPIKLTRKPAPAPAKTSDSILSNAFRQIIISLAENRAREDYLLLLSAKDD